MRGKNTDQQAIFSYVSLEDRIPKDETRVALGEDAELAVAAFDLDARFAALDPADGRW